MKRGPDFVDLSLRQAWAVKALQRKGCVIVSARIEGSTPVIEVDRAPLDSPAMVRVVRGSAGRIPRHVYVAEFMGCTVEAPARARGAA
jgi:hypothetical protein